MIRQAGNGEQERGWFWRSWDLIKPAFIRDVQQVIAGSVALFLRAGRAIAHQPRTSGCSLPARSVALHQAELRSNPEPGTAAGTEPDPAGGHGGKPRAVEGPVREPGSFGLYSNDNQAEFL